MEEDFLYNSVLEAINVNNDNKNYSSRGGVLYNKTGTKLVRCPVGKKGNILWTIIRER